MKTTRLVATTRRRRRPKPVLTSRYTRLLATRQGTLRVRRSLDIRNLLIPTLIPPKDSSPLAQSSARSGIVDFNTGTAGYLA